MVRSPVGWGRWATGQGLRILDRAGAVERWSGGGLEVRGGGGNLPAPLIPTLQRANRTAWNHRPCRTSRPLAKVLADPAEAAVEAAASAGRRVRDALLTSLVQSNKFTARNSHCTTRLPGKGFGVPSARSRERPQCCAPFPPRVRRWTSARTPAGRSSPAPAPTGGRVRVREAAPARRGTVPGVGVEPRGGRPVAGAASPARRGPGTPSAPAGPAQSDPSLGG